METPVDVLLLTSDPHRQSQWRRVLDETGGKILAVKEVDWQVTSLPDLVVTDGSSPQVDAVFLDRCVDRELLGVVSVGATTSADVLLPADCSDVELRIACQLLAKIVRLRRQRRSLLRSQIELSRLAHRDPLTDLPNRRAWDEQSPERAKIACQHQRPLCLALLDLDRFKQLNDRFGHCAGDRVLRHAGQALTNRSLPDRDFVARLGGDEFAWLISGVNVSEALKLVESVRADLAGGTEPDNIITASAGLAGVEAARGNPLHQLFDAADRALRDAKSQGRNRTVAIDV